MNTLQKGSESELAVACELTRLGGLVSFPVTHNSQYDMIVDVKGKLNKIQVKRAYLADKKRENTLCVETKRVFVKHSGEHRTIIKRYEKGAYDFLIAHYPSTNEFWILTFELCDKYSRQVYIRAKNNSDYRGKWSLLGINPSPQ